MRLVSLFETESRSAFIKVWRIGSITFRSGWARKDHSMRAVTEYRDRAQECRKLAGMVHKLEDKYALDCAAQSWERLADRRERDIEAED
jgi:hypothetical protein